MKRLLICAFSVNPTYVTGLQAGTKLGLYRSCRGSGCLRINLGATEMFNKEFPRKRQAIALAKIKHVNSYFEEQFVSPSEFHFECISPCVLNLKYQAFFFFFNGK